MHNIPAVSSNKSANQQMSKNEQSSKGAKEQRSKGAKEHISNERVGAKAIQPTYKDYHRKRLKINNNKKTKRNKKG